MTGKKYNLTAEVNITFTNGNLMDNAFKNIVN